MARARSFWAFLWRAGRRRHVGRGFSSRCGHGAHGVNADGASLRARGSQQPGNRGFSVAFGANRLLPQVDSRLDGKGTDGVLQGAMFLLRLEPLSSMATAAGWVKAAVAPPTYCAKHCGKACASMLAKTAL